MRWLLCVLALAVEMAFGEVPQDLLDWCKSEFAQEPVKDEKRYRLGQYPMPLQFHLRQDFKRTDHFSSPPLFDGGFDKFKDLLNARQFTLHHEKRYQNINDQRLNQRQTQD